MKLISSHSPFVVLSGTADRDAAARRLASSRIGQSCTDTRPVRPFLDNEVLSCHTASARLVLPTIQEVVMYVGRCRGC